MRIINDYNYNYVIWYEKTRIHLILLNCVCSCETLMRYSYYSYSYVCTYVYTVKFYVPIKSVLCSRGVVVTVLLLGHITRMYIHTS